MKANAFINNSKNQALETPKVLIADDDEATRILLRVAIIPWGYKVVEARDGEEAWEIMQQPDPPQILILDWLMPKLDGVALCKRINQELESRPYIIFLTRMTGTENVIQGLEAGADEFMLKPFDLSELRIRIFAGERIIKYRNQLAEQNKQLQNYISSNKTLIEEQSKQIIPLGDLVKILEEIHRNISELSENLVKNDEFANSGQEIRELKGKLQNIIEIIKGYESTPKILKEEPSPPAQTKPVSTPAIKKNGGLVDMDRMRAFFGNDTDIIHEFLQTFVSLAGEHLKEIEKGIDQKNAESAKYYFHLLGSASGNSGIMKMYDLCGKAEERLAVLDWETVNRVYQSLKETIKKLEVEISSQPKKS